MIRRKRYLLPETPDHLSIPRSTKYHRQSRIDDTVGASCLNEDVDILQDISHEDTETNTQRNEVLDKGRGTIPVDSSDSSFYGQFPNDVSFLDNIAQLEALLLYCMVRNDWSRQSISDVLMIIQCLPLQCNFKIPSVASFVKKYCNQSYRNPKYICPKCNSVISGTSSDENLFNDDSAGRTPDGNKYCRNCEETFDVTFLSKNHHYFLTFDLSAHLREFLEENRLDQSISASSDGKI